MIYKNTPKVNHFLKYNPSLDGIRGIAILFVLLFHIWPEYFLFGYLGVDIFFILSGYLITQIIYTKLESNTFKFKEFYRNRVRRIFPAVIIILLFTLLIGYLFLFPSELENLGKHMKSSAFFYQNFRLIGEVGYWDEVAQLKPLLHFWSLSIEEQFYLFWPLLIFLIYRLKLNLIYSLFTLLVISFSLQYIMDIDTFYHSLARFWELILGGLVYALSNKYSILLSKNNKLFSFYPLVFLGLISFPLYLWHYAIISYMYIFGLDVKEYGFIIIFVSILLSFLTYRYVEIYSREQISYKFVLILFVFLLGIGCIGKYIHKHEGLKSRTHLISNDIFKKQFIKTPFKNKNGVLLVSKILGYKPTNNFIKSTSTDLSKQYIFITGDSHARSSYPGFAQEFKKQGYETLLLANSSCPPYIGGAMGKNINDLNKCKQKINNIYKLINSSLNIKKIIFATRAPKYMYGLGYGIVDGSKKKPYSGSKFEEYFIDKPNWDQKDLFLSKVDKLFSVFKKENQFYFLLENPELGFSPKNCMVRPFNIFKSYCKIKLEDYINRSDEYRQFVYNLAKKHKNITLLDPQNMYCDSLYCYAVKNGKMLYADDDHHSIDGSIMQAKYFMDKILNVK